MRCLERSSEVLDSQPPSSWRISRRSTSSLMRLAPVKLMLRTYTRLPGSTKKVSDTVWLVLSAVGTGSTLAKA